MAILKNKNVKNEDGIWRYQKIKMLKMNTVYGDIKKIKMKYDPEKHHRRSIRLNGYDYSQEGAYFVTICCRDRICRFGYIENNKMILNECGSIAYNEWPKLSERFLNSELNVFQIMPNHMHGIIVLKNLGATLAVAPVTVAKNSVADNMVADNMVADNMVADNMVADNMVANAIRRAGASPAPTGGTVGDIVGAYKSIVANECLEIFKSKNKLMGKLWQRNYYEHIIRTEQSYQIISGYIVDNPSKWNDDKFFNK